MKCEYCGSDREGLMPSFWSDRTRWFCGIDCLNGFRSVAVGSQYDEEALDGAPGTARKIMKELKDEAKETDGAIGG